MIFLIGNNNDCTLDQLIRRKTKRFLDDAQPVATLCYHEQSGAITGVSTANPAVVTSPEHGLQNGQTVVIRGVEAVAVSDGSHVVSVANGVHVVANVTTDTFELTGVNSSAQTYTGEGIWYLAVPAGIEIALEPDEEVNGRYVGVFNGTINYRKLTQYRVYLVDQGPYAGEYEWFLWANAEDRT